MYIFFQEVNKDVEVHPKGNSIDFTKGNLRLIVECFGKEIVFYFENGPKWRTSLKSCEVLSCKITNIVNESFNLMSLKGF